MGGPALEKTSFSVSSQLLHGFFRRNDERPEFCVLFLHPHPLFGGGLDDRITRSLEAAVAEEGFCTFRFGFRGSHSTPHGYSGVAGATEDIFAAVGMLESRLEVRRVLFVGYSFGAAAALRAAARGGPTAVVTLSASASLVAEDDYPLNRLAGIDCPVLLFHGTGDTTVPWADSDVLCGMIGASAKVRLLDGESHFYERSLAQVVDEVRVFVSRHA